MSKARKKAIQKLKKHDKKIEKLRAKLTALLEDKNTSEEISETEANLLLQDHPYILYLTPHQIFLARVANDAVEFRRVTYPQN